MISIGLLGQASPNNINSNNNSLNSVDLSFWDYYNYRPICRWSFGLCISFSCLTIIFFILFISYFLYYGKKSEILDNTVETNIFSNVLNNTNNSINVNSINVNSIKDNKNNLNLFKYFLAVALICLLFSIIFAVILGVYGSNLINSFADLCGIYLSKISEAIKKFVQEANTSLQSLGIINGNTLSSAAQSGLNMIALNNNLDSNIYQLFLQFLGANNVPDNILNSLNATKFSSSLTNYVNNNTYKIYLLLSYCNQSNIDICTNIVQNYNFNATLTTMINNGSINNFFNNLSDNILDNNTTLPIFLKNFYQLMDSGLFLSINCNSLLNNSTIFSNMLSSGISLEHIVNSLPSNIDTYKNNQIAINKIIQHPTIIAMCNNINDPKMLTLLISQYSQLQLVLSNPILSKFFATIPDVNTFNSLIGNLVQLQSLLQINPNLTGKQLSLMNRNSNFLNILQSNVNLSLINGVTQFICSTNIFSYENISINWNALFAIFNKYNVWPMILQNPNVEQIAQNINALLPFLTPNTIGILNNYNWDLIFKNAQDIVNILGNNQIQSLIKNNTNEQVTQFFNTFDLPTALNILSNNVNTKIILNTVLPNITANIPLLKNLYNNTIFLQDLNTFFNLLSLPNYTFTSTLTALNALNNNDLIFLKVGLDPKLIFNTLNASTRNALFNFFQLNIDIINSIDKKFLTTLMSTNNVTNIQQSISIIAQLPNNLIKTAYNQLNNSKNVIGDLSLLLQNVSLLSQYLPITQQLLSSNNITQTITILNANPNIPSSFNSQINDDIYSIMNSLNISPYTMGTFLVGVDTINNKSFIDSFFALNPVIVQSVLASVTSNQCTMTNLINFFVTSNNLSQFLPILSIGLHQLTVGQAINILVSNNLTYSVVSNYFNAYPVLSTMNLDTVMLSMSQLPSEIVNTLITQNINPVFFSTPVPFLKTLAAVPNINWSQLNQWAMVNPAINLAMLQCMTGTQNPAFTTTQISTISSTNLLLVLKYPAANLLSYLQLKVGNNIEGYLSTIS